MYSCNVICEGGVGQVDFVRFVFDCDWAATYQETTFVFLLHRLSPLSHGFCKRVHEIRGSQNISLESSLFDQKIGCSIPRIDVHDRVFVSLVYKSRVQLVIDFICRDSECSHCCAPKAFDRSSCPLACTHPYLANFQLAMHCPMIAASLLLLGKKPHAV